MFDERSPIYRQIAERIRGDVLSGTLGEDEQVMSTTQYASFYRINPATAAKAFQELVDEGILYKRRGVGMFVAPGAREHLRVQRRARFFDDVVDPMVAEAQAIGVPIDEVVRRIREVSAAASEHAEPAPVDARHGPDVPSLPADRDVASEEVG